MVGVTRASPELERVAARTNHLARLIAREDPGGCCGQELTAGKAGENGAWTWFRVFGFDKMRQRAMQCDRVRDATSREAAELESAVGRGVRLIPCYVEHEKRALVAALG